MPTKRKIANGSRGWKRLSRVRKAKVKKAGYAFGSGGGASYAHKYTDMLTRGQKRARRKHSNPGFNLHSLIKWGIIVGVGYFLFTKFVKPNLSSALSGIVNDPQMSWAYIDPQKMLRVQEGNKDGMWIRNQPIGVGRGTV